MKNFLCRNFRKLVQKFDKLKKIWLEKMKLGEGIKIYLEGGEKNVRSTQSVRRAFWRKAKHPLRQKSVGQARLLAERKERIYIN